jgi:hypothetical protein
MKKISEIFFSSSQTFNVISHPYDQDWTAIDIFSTKSVFPRLMNFPDDGLISGNLVRSILFVPLYPLVPLLNNFFSVELPGDGESCDGINVGVELLSHFGIGIIFSINFFDFVLI